ncbi:hypothetical protein BJY00DRAFT_315229 [Aspergillus carlsbadensis]|nr:hypothetical protein BJY00DRAFT_315229 [Aspergillus carlsbadensis]
MSNAVPEPLNEIAAGRRGSSSLKYSSQSSNVHLTHPSFPFPIPFALTLASLIFNTPFPIHPLLFKTRLTIGLETTTPLSTSNHATISSPPAASTRTHRAPKSPKPHPHPHPRPPP